MTSTADFLTIVRERGFLHQMTNEQGLKAQFAKGPVTGYCGLEPTATSLHVGHLYPIMLMRWFQKTGNKPIMLVGGATAKVGDPSFKDESRALLDDATIAKNIEGVLKNYRQFIDFGEGQAIIVNNADWLDKLNYIEFLRDVGVHFTVNRMLSFDSVKLRMEREQSLSFIEFNYMIMQGYDFVELYKNYNCILQMSGSDQWGNIVNGIDLGRRQLGVELFGLTTPLLTNADGSKMGKTASGAVWLSADKLSPYDYYQFWRNTADADVERRLAIFTELPMDEIRRLSALQGAEINNAKKILAFEATKICHGIAAAEAASETAQQAFEQGAMAAGLPTFKIDAARLADSVLLTDLFVECGLADSKGEAKRLIKGGGARLNDIVITDETAKLEPAAFQDDTAKLSSGRKKHALMRLK